VKDDLSRYLRLAESEEVVITRHGRPAGVLIGFGSEDER
jgi:prevent-host-death family protein